jgi:hypothetical protein
MAEKPEAHKPEAHIADLLSEARLTLDQALERIRAGEPVGTLSQASLQRLRAVADNTSCQNTGCGGAARQAADTSSG